MAELSYGIDAYAFDPPCPDVAEGHILGRKPTGYDTDSASDWKDFGLPQVTVTYPTGGTWYCNQNVTLRWTATNPNGPNSDLLITLWYIRDTDGNGVVSGGDATTIIAQDIANTGSYNWRVSPCHYGYVWIKVIARGPENFMISGSCLSGRVFEPPAPEGEETLLEEGETFNELETTNESEEGLTTEETSTNNETIETVEEIENFGDEAVNQTSATETTEEITELPTQESESGNLETNTSETKNAEPQNIQLEENINNQEVPLIEDSGIISLESLSPGEFEQSL